MAHSQSLVEKNILREGDIGVKLGEAVFRMSFLLHSSEDKAVEGITAGIINTLRCVISGLRREVDNNLGCPETSVRGYHYSLRNNTEECSSQIIYSFNLI
jgi:hypothetical protein